MFTDKILKRCRLCDFNELELAFDFGMQPIVHHLVESQKESHPLFPFLIGVCPRCTFLQIVEPVKPQIFYENYFTLSSWKPQPHAERLVDLIETFVGVQENTRIFEVGCNDGGFLKLLQKRGFDLVMGVEPTKDASDAAKVTGAPVVRGFYQLSTLGHFSDVFSRPDVIVSRQVIEHISDLSDFMETIARHIKPGGLLALELPDHGMNYETLDYSFWEEHVNYFTLDTLNYLLLRFGFRIIHYESRLFSGKCMFVLAVQDRKREPVYRSHRASDAVFKYIRIFPEFKRRLSHFLEQQGGSGGVYVYGCGARSSSLVNLLEIGGLFRGFIDDRVEKQGKFVPGCLLPINSSDSLPTQSTVALGVNAEFERLVLNRHRFRTAFSLLPPSILLPDFWNDLRLN